MKQVAELSKLDQHLLMWGSNIASENLGSWRNPQVCYVDGLPSDPCPNRRLRWSPEQHAHFPHSSKSFKDAVRDVKTQDLVFIIHAIMGGFTRRAVETPGKHVIALGPWC